MPPAPLRRIVVLGGGSAGLIAALALRHRLTEVEVRVLHSAELGVIGVGEGTTLPFRSFLFDWLGLPRAGFFAEAQPTWKLGLRFLWGPRPVFYFPFTLELTQRWSGLTRSHGFYDTPETAFHGWASAIMHHGRAFPRRPDGWPHFHDEHAYHIENTKLVAYLEARARERGVVFIEGTVSAVESAGENVTALVLASGERVTADFFIDASGFRAELLGRALGEPFIGYERSLFCDRALIGGWARTTEPLLACTTCETMDAGWCWQIEHEHWINRGYVYASRFLSEDAARAELLAKSPRIDPAKLRAVPFASGRRARLWVGNVAAIGNAGGFVEPLEATALGAACVQSVVLADLLADADAAPTPALAGLWNRHALGQWDDIRDFLAVHYAFNTRLDTPFWRAARHETDLAGAAPLVECYRANGPTAIPGGLLDRPGAAFHLGAHLALLVGQRVPHDRPWTPPPEQRALWERHLSQSAAQAQAALDVRQCLAAIRHPAWAWR